MMRCECVKFNGSKEPLSLRQSALDHAYFISIRQLWTIANKTNNASVSKQTKRKENEWTAKTKACGD